MSVLRYPTQAVAGDLLRGTVGCLLVGVPLAATTPPAWLAATLLLCLGLFLVFTASEQLLQYASDVLRRAVLDPVDMQPPAGRVGALIELGHQPLDLGDVMRLPGNHQQRVQPLHSLQA